MMYPYVKQTVIRYFVTVEPNQQPRKHGMAPFIGSWSASVHAAGHTCWLSPVQGGLPRYVKPVHLHTHTHTHTHTRLCIITSSPGPFWCIGESLETMYSIMQNIELICIVLSIVHAWPSLWGTHIQAFQSIPTLQILITPRSFSFDSWVPKM